MSRRAGRGPLASTGLRLLVVLLVVLVVLLGASALSPALAQPPTPAETARLAALLDAPPRLVAEALAGERPVDSVSVAGQRLDDGVVVGVIEAGAERLFTAVTDWVHYHEFMPFVETSEAVAGTGDRFDLRLDLPFPAGSRTARVSATSAVATRQGHRVWSARWREVSAAATGDPRQRERDDDALPASRGAWTLVALSPDRTLVSFRMLSDAGPSIPRFLQRRGTLQTLPYVLDGLAQHVRRCRYDDPRPAGCAE